MVNIELRLAAPKSSLAFQPGRRNLEIALLEAGKNALAAGARTFWVRVERDDTGRVTSLDLADDGEGIDIERLRQVLGQAEIGPTEGRPHSWFGLGFATLLACCRRIAITATDIQDEAVALQAADDAGTFRTSGAQLPRRRLGRLRTQIQLDGIPREVGSMDFDADEILSRLPLGDAFGARLEDFLGRRDIQPRSYRGEALAEGSLTTSWRAGGASVSETARYELRLLDRPPRTGRRSAAAGVDVRREGVVVATTTFGLPVRRSEIGRVTGHFDVGTWYPLDPATAQPLRRHGPARGFGKAARAELERVVAGIGRPEAPPDSFRLSRIASQLTQRLSKAVVQRPDLAPVLDRTPRPVRRRRVLDIPWVGPGSNGHGLVATQSGLRVRWTANAGPDEPPAWFDPASDSILINHRHPLRAQFAAAGGGRGEELWGALVASLVIHDLRTGGSGDLAGLRSIVDLATLALDESSRPLSTRSQRERAIRDADADALARQFT